MTQEDMILQYMREYGSITPWEAMREFGCMRLGARIFDLKQKGHEIETDTVKNTNRFGHYVSYAKYRLKP